MKQKLSGILKEKKNSILFQKKESLDKLINFLNEKSELQVFNAFSKGNTFGALQNIDEVKGLNEFCNEFDTNAKNIVFTIGVNPVNSSFFGQKIRLNQPGVHLKTRGKRMHSPARVFRLSLNFLILAVLDVFHVCTYGHHHEKNPAMW